MFSSEPFSADPFAAVSVPGATAAKRTTVRPSVLDAEALAAFEGSADAASWLPDHMDVASLELPEIDPADSLGTSASSGAMPGRRRDVDAELRAALAERDAQHAEELERLQQDAYAAGVAAGRADAESAMRDAMGTALEALWLATEEVRSAESRWLAALQDNIAALVVAAARHVVGREVLADDALVQELAARALAEFPQDHPLHVRVHPHDLATLKAVAAGAPRLGEMRWTADARVERGGCVVEGRERIVDGRVDMALERVYRRLSGHHA